MTGMELKAHQSPLASSPSQVVAVCSLTFHYYLVTTTSPKLPKTFHLSLQLPALNETPFTCWYYAPMSLDWSYNQPASLDLVKILQTIDYSFEKQDHVAAVWSQQLNPLTGRKAKDDRSLL